MSDTDFDAIRNYFATADALCSHDNGTWVVPIKKSSYDSLVLAGQIGTRRQAHHAMYKRRGARRTPRFCAGKVTF